MTSLRIIHRQYTQVTRERDPNDKWDADDTITDNSVDGIEIGEDYHRLYLEDAKVGEIVHLIYAVYSTGDSFHCARGYGFDPILVQRNRDLAVKNAKILKSIRKEDGWGQSVELALDNGTTFKYSPPWLGYFEDLDYVEVASFVISHGRIRF